MPQPTSTDAGWIMESQNGGSVGWRHYSVPIAGRKSCDSFVLTTRIEFVSVVLPSQQQVAPHSHSNADRPAQLWTEAELMITVHFS